MNTRSLPNPQSGCLFELGKVGIQSYPIGFRVNWKWPLGTRLINLAALLHLVLALLIMKLMGVPITDQKRVTLHDNCSNNNYIHPAFNS